MTVEDGPGNNWGWSKAGSVVANDRGDALVRGLRPGSAFTVWTRRGEVYLAPGAIFETEEEE